MDKNFIFQFYANDLDKKVDELIEYKEDEVVEVNINIPEKVFKILKQEQSPADENGSRQLFMSRLNSYLSSNLFNALQNWGETDDFYIIQTLEFDKVLPERIKKIQEQHGNPADNVLYQVRMGKDEITN